MKSASRGLALFARLGSRPIPRVLRMMAVAGDLGYETVFCAARRDRELALEEVLDGVAVRRIGPYFPLVNGRRPIAYILGVLGYNLALALQLMRQRPAIVHCSDVEALPAAVALKWLLGFRLIYNIHDNLSERYPVPPWVAAVLNQCEGLGVVCSTTTLVPERFRRESLPRWCRHKVEVVRNTPRDVGMAAVPRFDGVIKIFYGGWIDEGRGIRHLLDLVAGSEDIELIVAGGGDGDLLQKVKSAARVSYLGVLDYKDALEQMGQCHFVAALYDPVRPINRHAASNKLAESLCIGRPAIANSEMLIVGDLADYGCLISEAYGQTVCSVASRLRQACVEGVGAGSRYHAACLGARRAYEELYDWSTACEGMAKAFGCTRDYERQSAAER